MIEINNLTGVSVDNAFLKKITKKVLKKKKLGISIVLVEPKKIKELNKKYRRKNRTTDVLSFLYDDCGEIVICPDEIKKNAKKFATPFKKEFIRVLIHGILHLLGCDHGRSKKETEKMCRKEEYYLSQLEISH